MILLIIVTDSDDYLGLGRAELKNEIQRSGSFLVGDITQDIRAALRSATDLRCDYLVLEAGADERRLAERVEAIVDYRQNSGHKWLSNILIVSKKVSEYAVRRLGDVNVMLGFVRPSGPEVIAANLERFWIDSENSAYSAEGSAGYVFEGDPVSVDSVRTILNWLDISSSYTGYRYLVDAVMMVLRSKEPRVLTKEIYPAIGIRYKKSPDSVERAIRFLIPAAFNNENWGRLFPELKSPPTNSKFICALADKIRKR
ncbi:MAG: sporulation initiation factor Spo0A C-terminal domain-containing protein [Clostridia bacterium]|nr:sporulation initiation factor Spo0A C-terminal domain-containing protein [Clostridia bacterium]